MTVKELISILGLSNSDFKTDGKRYIHEIEDSDTFSHLVNTLDDDDRFEEDLDAQDINLFGNTIAFIDDVGELECTLVADFENDKYTLEIVEV